MFIPKLILTGVNLSKTSITMIRSTNEVLAKRQHFWVIQVFENNGPQNLPCHRVFMSFPPRQKPKDSGDWHRTPNSTVTQI